MHAMKGRTLLGLALLVGATACYLSIVVVRQGPPPGGDTTPLTAVTSDLGAGHLHAAASNDSLPNPPGYPLLASPLVAAFPSLFGSNAWCLTSGRAASMHRAPAYATDPNFAADVDECGHQVHLLTGGTAQLPPWYRAQGILGVTSWLVLALGALSLLRASDADSPGRMAGLLFFLAFLPAASSAIVQLYHPQDIVSLGLALAGMAQALRKRWILSGALLGLAVLTKQYALLLVLPTIVVAPSKVPRLQVALAALVVLAAGIVPFFLAAPQATLENFSGFSAGGAVSGATLLSISGVKGDVASAVARDAPVLFAAAVCALALLRRGDWLTRPQALVAIGLACISGRLVFESVIFAYYLLAPSVLFLMLDLVARRSAYRSVAWCAGAAFFVAIHPGNTAVDAFGTFVFAVLAVAAGITEMLRLSAPGGTAQPASDLAPGLT